MKIMEQQNLQEHLDNFYKSFGEYEAAIYHRDQSKLSLALKTRSSKKLSSLYSDPASYCETPEQFFTRIYEEIGVA